VSRVLLVALGGALGSVARYGVGVAAPRLLGTTFPWGTLGVNLLGSFLIALVMHLALTTAAISPSARLFLTTGVMGGFTTYSSFNFETLALVGDRLWGVAALSVGHRAGCLVAGVLGPALGRAMAGVKESSDGNARPGGEQTLVRIFLGRDQWRAPAAWRCWSGSERGAAETTVLGHRRLRARSVVHTTHLLELSEDLPCWWNSSTPRRRWSDCCRCSTRW
jgi:CrcB protein